MPYSDPDRGLAHFKDTLGPYFVKGVNHVFLWRFLQMFRTYRGQHDFVHWVGRFEIAQKRLLASWADLIDLTDRFTGCRHGRICGSIHWCTAWALSKISKGWRENKLPSDPSRTNNHESANTISKCMPIVKQFDVTYSFATIRSERTTTWTFCFIKETFDKSPCHSTRACRWNSFSSNCSVFPGLESLIQTLTKVKLRKESKDFGSLMRKQEKKDLLVFS